MSFEKFCFPKIALLAGALGLSLIPLPSSAQPYGSYYGPPRGGEEVIIQAPRYHGPARSAIGAPIEDVSLSRPVRFDDLDLRTSWGAHALHNRISYTARTLCRRLDFEYPISTSDSPDCYRTAMAYAMEQADDAIARARGYNGDY